MAWKNKEDGRIYWARVKEKYNSRKREQWRKGGTYRKKNGDLYRRFSEKYLIRAKSRWAVQAGRIKKEPCKICGNKMVQGHHENYLEPLKIIWLCKEHHQQLHGNNK